MNYNHELQRIQSILGSSFQQKTDAPEVQQNPKKNTKQTIETKQADKPKKSSLKRQQSAVGKAQQGKLSSKSKQSVNISIKDDTQAKKNTENSSPFSQSHFMINLSPVLRRAHTNFMNFDSLTPNTYKEQNQQNKERPDISQQAPKQKQNSKKSKTQKGDRRKGKKLSVTKKIIERDTYKSTSRWNDVISDKEIQRLVNSTCTAKSCRDRQKAILLQQELTQAALANQETNYPTTSYSGTLTRNNSLLQSTFDYKKFNVLPGLYNMGNTCFANSVLQCLAHTAVFREYCRLGRHSRGCFSDISK